MGVGAADALDIALVADVAVAIAEELSVFVGAEEYEAVADSCAVTVNSADDEGERVLLGVRDSDVDGCEVDV